MGQSNADISNTKTKKLPYSEIKPQIIQLDLPAEDKGIGGLIAADVDNDLKKSPLPRKSRSTFCGRCIRRLVRGIDCYQRKSVTHL